MWRDCAQTDSEGCQVVSGGCQVATLGVSRAHDISHESIPLIIIPLLRHSVFNSLFQETQSDGVCWQVKSRVLAVNSMNQPSISFSCDYTPFSGQTHC